MRRALLLLLAVAACLPTAEIPPVDFIREEHQTLLLLIEDGELDQARPTAFEAIDLRDGAPFRTPLSAGSGTRITVVLFEASLDDLRIEAGRLEPSADPDWIPLEYAGAEIRRIEQGKGTWRAWEPIPPAALGPVLDLPLRPPKPCILLKEHRFLVNEDAPFTGILDQESSDGFVLVRADGRIVRVGADEVEDRILKELETTIQATWTDPSTGDHYLAGEQRSLYRLDAGLQGDLQTLIAPDPNEPAATRLLTGKNRGSEIELLAVTDLYEHILYTEIGPSGASPWVTHTIEDLMPTPDELMRDPQHSGSILWLEMAGHALLAGARRSLYALSVGPGGIEETPHILHMNADVSGLFEVEGIGRTALLTGALEGTGNLIRAVRVQPDPWHATETLAQSSSIQRATRMIQINPLLFLAGDSRGALRPMYTDTRSCATAQTSPAAVSALRRSGDLLLVLGRFGRVSIVRITDPE